MKLKNTDNNIAIKPWKWFFNWDVVVTCVSLLLIAIAALMIPYQDSISFNAQFHTQHKIVPVISPFNGIIKKDVFDMNDAITPNAFLFTIYDLSAQKETSVYAQEAGYYLPNKIEFRSKTYVSKNDTLFYIIPDIKSQGEVYCTAVADKFNISRLKTGSKVIISVTRDEEIFSIPGTISFISQIPDGSGKYPFQISLENKDVQHLSEKGVFYLDKQGKAQVNFETQKLAYKLLSFL
ncbi:hypothetical protein HDE69_000228 [Pedobacter cryoconitis]|uniref:HlyD family secretion protein n=1 Tax=Pedobacter cryoconitis TaxID=188932 RepID=A0A7W9DHP9_9SPHI|nr:HlyD family secretion protein [Pedobacter cryoconitis]MBB5619192.1 hypothetical protein [Pedobacter cryoconitis]